VDGADGARDLLGRGALEQVPAGAGPDGAQHALVRIVGGEDQNARLGGHGGEAGQGLDAVHSRELQVEQHHVGPQALGERQGLLARPDRADDAEVRLVLQDSHQALADDGMVVDDQDTDHAGPRSSGRSGGSGTVATTVVPRPGRLAMRNVPPSSRARSRIPWMP
jgi:hypothetical protein